MKFKTLSLAALALMGTIITACSSSDDTIADTPQPVITPQQPENTSKTVTLTTTVGLDDGSATTRALTANGVKTFAAGDQIALIYTQNGGATAKAVSAALPEGTYGKSAEFTFELTNPKTSEPVTYIYPAAMAGETGVDYSKLSSQTGGTLTDLGSKYDLCTKSGAWVAGNLPELTLDNELAILAVTLKDYSGSNIITGGLNEVAVSAVTSEGTNTYTVTPTGSTFGEEVIYVAILPAAGATIKVTATDGTKNYIKTLTGKDYEINNGYNVSWLMTEATPLSETTPMTMEALTAGTIVVNKPRSGMQYSKNGGAKATVSSVGGTITVEAGDKVEFYGNGTSITQYGSSNPNNSTTIAGGTANVKVYGNIMSLVNETGFATATTLTAEYTFDDIFNGNTALTDASGLLLPAPTMTKSCYEGMFHSCSSLTAAPALPATTLAEACYYGMFYGCTSLTAAPALPATTLAGACYGSMFWECTSLTDAPAELPATELAFDCYGSMFLRCSSLETAPVLPATTLVENCYTGMFHYCTKLSAVTCLATDIDYPEDYTSNWLDGVAETGTFTKAASMTGWPTNSADGIPSGWTVKNYGQ